MNLDEENKIKYKKLYNSLNQIKKELKTIEGINNDTYQLASNTLEIDGNVAEYNDFLNLKNTNELLQKDIDETLSSIIFKSNN